MADLTITINPPAINSITVSEGNPCNTVVISDGIPAHNNTHAPNGSDSLETWYATVGNLAYVSGLTTLPSGIIYDTGNQNISGVKNFSSRPTVNGSGVMLSGEIAGTGYLTGYVQTSQTGQFTPTGATGAFLTTGVADNRYALQSATGNFVTSDNTGNFVTSTQTGQLTGVFYPYSNNPAAYIQGAVVRPSNTGNFVDITSNQTINGRKIFSRAIICSTGLFGINSTTGDFTGQTIAGGSGNFVSGNYASILGGMGNFSNGLASTVGGGMNNSTNGEYSVICGGSDNNVSSSQYSFVGGGFGNTIFESNYSAIHGGQGNTINGGSNNTSFGESNFAADSKLCILVGANNTITNSTGAFVVGSQNSIDGSNNAIVLSAYASVSSGSNTAVIAYDSGIYLNGPTKFDTRPTLNGTGFLLSGEASIPSTGYLTGYVNKTETGNFYPRSNPSGYITGVDLSPYITTVVATGISGHLQGQISNLNNNTGSYVVTGLTGNFLTNESPIGTIQAYAKNDESFSLYKGQPVYIGGANGANALIKRASNTGEPTFSKTIGLLAQNLNANDFGYVVSEGILEGFDTSAAAAGDPMWLGTTGDILFGTGNKPYGNNHLVYLGVVLRSQSVNGKVYVKPQNGFEIDELHRVYAKNASNKDTLLYDSGSGSWFSRQITTGDVSGVSAYVLNNQTGLFVTSSSTGAFLTTGAADNRYTLQSETGNFVTTSQTGAFSSSVIQTKYAEQTGHSSGLIVGDYRFAASAIPNVSGNLIFSVPITPTNSGSLININFFGLFSSSGTNAAIMIGRSGETNCRYQHLSIPNTVRSDYVTSFPVSWSELAGGTGTITYQIRAVGLNALYMNRSAGTSTYPANNKSSVLVQEIRLS